MKKNILEAWKYTIVDHVTTENKKEILHNLEISNSTFWRKSTAKIGDNYGFEVYQLIEIAKILNVEIMQLLTTEGKIYAELTPNDKL